MSFSKTKEHQYAIDRDLALYHGIDRDTPGGIAGQALRRSRQTSGNSPMPHYGESQSNGEKSDSGGRGIFWLLLLLVLL